MKTWSIGASLPYGAGRASNRRRNPTGRSKATSGAEPAAPEWKDALKFAQQPQALWTVVLNTAAFMAALGSCTWIFKNEANTTRLQAELAMERLTSSQELAMERLKSSQELAMEQLTASIDNKMLQHFETYENKMLQRFDQLGDKGLVACGVFAIALIFVAHGGKKGGGPATT